MFEITTDRLVLRKAITEQEKKSLVHLLNDWEVARWLTNVPYPYTYDDLEDYLLISNSNELDLNIFFNDQIIGRVGLTLDNDDNYFDLGYFLGKDFWSKGYATEASESLLNYALDNLDSPKIKSGYFIDNFRSGNILKKLGFKEIGIKKWYSLANKKEMDLMLMVL
tara:strand:+ start:605 stop:1102 length:498 start_codon:yes stop_codon:yes gene_type:complete